MHATEDLGDALAATKRFLLPFEFRRWLALAFVTFFLGGVGFNFSSPSFSTGGGDLPSTEPSGGVLAVLAAAVAVVVLVWLGFAAVRGVMDLVLVESLREERVELGRFWGRRWRQGLRLFAFRLAVSAAALLVVGLPVALLAFALGGWGSSALAALGLVLLVPVLLVVPVATALLNGFTTAFVAPVMVLEDAGVLAAWRRFYPTLRADWTEFAGYAAVNFGLAVVGGVLLSLGATLGALLALVPFVPLFGLGAALRTAVEPLGLAVMGATALAYGVVVVVVAAFAKVPVITYLRYYALLVLGDVDEDLDVVPLIRREVRAPEAEA